MKKMSPPLLLPRLRITQGTDIALGPGKADLLEWIAKTGSITRAASQMGMSYMRAWTLIQTMNKSFKRPVVESVRGGRERGGAKLTPTGTRALQLYRRMEKASLKSTQADWGKLRQLLRP